MHELVGQVIRGVYRVESKVGSGGMAEVYKVWDQKRSVHVAMKVLHADCAEDKVFLRMFNREGQTLATLQHPNIVRFYGLEQEGGLVFILLDFVDGTTLRKEIFQANGAFTPQRVMEIMRPVCAALYYAHNMKIVHCDVKPANIMISRNGTILLSDFGIARIASGGTMTVAGAGTPAYMAPEQARGQEPVPQTDIYSLGIVLYEMITGGERPFTGESTKATGTTNEKVRWEQIQLAPPPPSKFNRAISRNLDDVVLKCLAKSPADRYRTPTDLFNDLSAALSNITTLSAPAKEQKAAAPPKLPPAPIVPPSPPPPVKPVKPVGSRPSDRTEATALLTPRKPGQPAGGQAPGTAGGKTAHVALGKPAADAKPSPLTPDARRRRKWIVLTVVGALMIALMAFLASGIWPATGAASPAAPTQAPAGGPAATRPAASTAAAPAATVRSPTSIPSPEIRRFFKEEFNGGYDDWDHFMQQGDESDLSLSITDGGLLFDIHGLNTYAYLFYEPQDYEDVRIDARAENIGTNDNNVTLFCRYSPEAGWYEFNVFNSGLYDILFTKPDSSGHLNYGTLAEGGSNKIKQGKATNEYSAVCDGSTLSLYINGSLVREVEATAYALKSGKVGFSVASLRSLPVQVRLDWFQIGEPD